MEVKLDKRYPVGAGAAAAWTVLRDIRAVAACMPGAQLTDQVDDRHFKGTVKSRIGPAVMSFGGDVELQAVDEADRRLELLAKGADKSGSSASMQLTARIEPGPDAGSAVLAGQATIVVAGKLAQFGNRLLVPVSDAMLQQFADNFGAAAQRAAAAAQPAAVAVETTAPTAESAGAPTSAQTSAPAGGAVDGAAASATEASDPAAIPPPAPAPPIPPPAAPPSELNALALLWTVFKTWLKGLFARKR